MKLLIAGSRDIYLDLGTIQNLIDIAIPMTYNITEVVSGNARGVDKSGENWADFQNIPIKKFKAEWDKYGKSAGPRRNYEMAQYADAALIIHNNSNGSLNMKENMLKLNKCVFEVIFKKYNTEK